MTPNSLDPFRLSSLQIVLASRSPRRQEIITNLGIKFSIRVLETEEDIPEGMKSEQAAEYLAQKKALAVAKISDANELIIGADTIVDLDGQMIGKPANREEAVLVLKSLSGKTHQVVTGVCLIQGSKQVLFHNLSLVTFKDLSEEEISFYIDAFSPYDKAGSYGVQDWMGLAGVADIQGSFFNVMGLPAKELYEQLFNFI